MRQRGLDGLRADEERLPNLAICASARSEARYLGVMADAAEIAGAPAEYVHDLRTRPARNIGPGTS